MKIFKQLLREFLLPFTVALIWTGSNIYFSKDDELSIIKFFNIFGPSFFLVAWMTGQVFRVKKQQGVENKLTTLINELEQKTNHLSDLVTGGDSIVDVELFWIDGKWIFNVSSIGQHTQFDVKLIIDDFEKRKLLMRKKKFFDINSDLYSKTYSLGTLNPNVSLMSAPLRYEMMEDQTDIVLDIRIYTRSRRLMKTIAILDANDRDKKSIRNKLIDEDTKEEIDVEEFRRTHSQ